MVCLIGAGSRAGVTESLKTPQPDEPATDPYAYPPGVPGSEPPLPFTGVLGPPQKSLLSTAGAGANGSLDQSSINAGEGACDVGIEAGTGEGV